MKIVIFSNSFWNFYNFRMPIIKALSKNNSVILIGKKDNYFNSIKKNLNIKIFNLNFSSQSFSIIDNFYLIVKIYLLLKKIRPDLLITFTLKPNIFGSFCARILKIPTISNITGLGTAFLKKNIFFNFIIILLKISQYQNKIIFFHNKYEKKIFLKLKIIKKNQARIINGSGIRLGEYKKKKFLKKKITNNFVFSGRLISDKGIFELIDAIKIIKTKYSNCSFTIFGLQNTDNRSSISPEIIKEWVKLGYINFYSNEKNINNLLANFDCFILPSYTEGMPKSLLEGAAAGLPILCSNIPGCRDLVKNNVNGFLFKPRSSIDLSYSIKKFIELPLNKRILFGKKSIYIVKNFFSEKKIVTEYLKTIDEICKNK